MKNFLNTKVKNINAITLIALIITIVVLIILATVVINLSLSDNGIFNRAREAKEQYQNAQTQEETEIAKVTNDIVTGVDSSRDSIMVPKEEYEELKQTVNELKNTMNSKIIKQRYTLDNKSIAKQSAVDFSFSIAKEGYTPLISQVSLSNATSSGAGSSVCVAYLQHIDGNTQYLWIRNNSSTTSKIKVFVDVLYLKNE